VDRSGPGPRHSFQPEPRAALLADPPVIAVGSFQHRCNECHRLFRTGLDDRRQFFQHTHIRTEHGINNRCANCHDVADRERLVLRDGGSVGFAASARLCAQCHGPAYRDWQRGMHGKTLGSWRADDPRRRRLQCVQCHDPHAPAYQPIEPLPAPNTLRMGDQHASHGPSQNPLRRSIGAGHEDGGQPDHGETHDTPAHEHAAAPQPAAEDHGP
ncbi:MAG: hypothetical protein ACF8R7_09800, partial [Phycisphaerales bacterium JB039]